MHIVIFTGGKFTKGKQTEKILISADYIIAADSGAATALTLGITPSAVVGDFDSLSKSVKQKLQKKGVEIISFQEEKDETDTELAVLFAVQKGATKITLFGGNSGDRFDHIIANLFLSLSIPIPLFFVDGNQISWIEKGPTRLTLSGKKDDVVSLIPLVGDVEGITLQNFQYGLTKETLLFGKPRGVSNILTESTGIISFTKGTLLIVHTSL